MKKFFIGALLASSIVSSALAEKLVVGATAAPHAVILEQIVSDLKDKGFELEIRIFNDYVTPNLSTDNGDLDANYFQHIPYLDKFNQDKGTKLVKTVGVHLEPMGIYSKSIKDLKDLQDGATIAVPNDPTNESRALDLLESLDIIKLDKNVEFKTAIDVIENPKNLKILELEAAALPRTLDDAQIAVINSNFAMNANLKPSSDALAIEKADNNPYVNIVVVKEGNENLPKIKALNEAIQSEKVKNFINENYNGEIIPSF